MNSSFTTAFLRESLDDSYAFFWQVYEGTPVIAQRAAKRLLPFSGRLEEIDSRPPFVVCNGNRRRHYAPLRRDPTLHRKFSEIADDRDIVKFAAKYGLLGFTWCHEVRKRDGSPPAIILIESVARWKRELAEMKRLVYLWELVKNKRLSLLTALIEREKDGIYITLSKQKNRIDDNTSALVRKWDMDGEQPLDAAIEYLTTSINKRTMGSIYPTALPSYNKRVYLLPSSLLSAMWLTFLWEVIGEVRPHKCPGCGEWFDPKRSTRVTCGDRCRKRRSRLKEKLEEKP